MPFAPFDFSGKVALVTGGNGGIGLGMALGMAQAGADVCIWGTNSEKNDFAQKQIQDFGVKSLAVRCDVSVQVHDRSAQRADEGQSRRLYSLALRNRRRVDALGTGDFQKRYANRCPVVSLPVCLPVRNLVLTDVLHPRA